MVLPPLSLLITLVVFWCLKLTGITLAGEAFCGFEEHIHGPDCPTQTLICPLPEQAPHTHSEACISMHLICPEAEIPAHSHDSSCLARELTCPLPEQDGHSHSEACYGSFLLCTIENDPSHTHGESCYAQGDTPLCGLDESPPHIHTAECYTPLEGVFVCGQEETPGHTHTDDCWHPGVGFGCGLSEADGHEHTAECLTKDTELDCGLEATPGHIHTAECYDTLEACPIPEHIHTENCYSNIDADLETEDDWEAIRDELSEGLSTPEALVSLANSQLGYEESTLNFQVDAGGVRRGITRYGQWYGNPYGDWSAMFVSFCLDYAGAESLPSNAGPESMRVEWEAEGLYRPAFYFHPEPGYLLFLDKDEDGRADAAAIVTQVEAGRLSAIEGDLDGRVAKTEYSLTDEMVMGYGFIPQPETLQFQPAEGPTLVARAEPGSVPVFVPEDLLVIYLEDPSGCYALDGFGGYVEVSVSEDGEIFTTEEQPELLFWKVFGIREDGSYEIRNAETGMYLEAATHPATYASGSQEDQSGGNHQYARAVSYTVYLDGTNGGLMSLQGAEVSSRTVTEGGTLTLPTAWNPPAKYSYTLKGWYDVSSGAYYDAGETMTVTRNCLLYADWVARTYDIGELNRYAADTVSTSEFITTHVFDYNSLFNTLSATTSYGGGTSTQWRLLSSGTVPATGQDTLNFIFVDHDTEGSISMPANRNVQNGTEYTQITPGLYNENLVRLLFDLDEEVVGKHYLGEGDHLFQYGDDPNDKTHYGYYYYDSSLNAASYNQSQERFYVYDYLERTVDSAGNDSYSDFLPLNSPYANTNGKSLGTYSYDGVHGEYVGTTHYAYDTKYSDSENQNSTNRVITNFWFGMATELEFYLPSKPNTTDDSGGRANQSMTGDDMLFEFTGDDDLWILIDGQLVLDIGGIHQEESGSINFSTGEVIVDGVVQQNSPVLDLDPGTHTLTMYYLERGSSMSNFKLRFNLSTRYSLSLRKENTLTADMLNGAQFSVYTDKSCTQEYAAELWTSKESHNKKDPPTNVFTVENGVAEMWGLAAGSTYYIVETRGPTSFGGTPSSGMIRLYLNNHGDPDYQILSQDGQVTPGYTVHGFKVDEETQQAYLVATNAPPGVQTTADVVALKKWADNKDHTGESVAVYLTVTDPDGTVRRLQEGILSSENGWQYQWTNLPKYYPDGNGGEDQTAPVTYGVEEAYVNGYYSKTSYLDTGSTYQHTTVSWRDRGAFEHGKSYLLRSRNGCLATTSTASDTGFLWLSEADAQNAPSALWTVSTTYNGQLQLINGNGQRLSFYYNNGSSGYPTDFFAMTGGETNEAKQYFRTAAASSNQFRLYYDGADGRDYYLVESMTGDHKFHYSLNQGDGLLLTAVERVEKTTSVTITGIGAVITNTPLEKETSLAVRKAWDYGKAESTDEHESLKVTVELLANGAPTGRTVTLSLKNNWRSTFRGLPYTDDVGNVISYSVEERWDNDDWIPEYGPVEVSGGTDPPTYTTTITNKYRWGMGGPELPSTGTAGRTLYQLCGGSIILLTLACAIVLRRKREGGQQ